MRMTNWQERVQRNILLVSNILEIKREPGRRWGIIFPGMAEHFFSSRPPTHPVSSTATLKRSSLCIFSLSFHENAVNDYNGYRQERVNAKAVHYGAGIGVADVVGVPGTPHENGYGYRANRFAGHANFGFGHYYWAVDRPFGGAAPLPLKENLRFLATVRMNRLSSIWLRRVPEGASFWE